MTTRLTSSNAPSRSAARSSPRRARLRDRRAPRHAGLPLAAAPRRSGRFAVDRARPGEAGRPSSGLGLVACGVVALAVFPLAGAAFLGQFLAPLAFVLLAISAAALFLGAVTRLEPPSS